MKCPGALQSLSASAARAVRFGTAALLALSALPALAADAPAQTINSAANNAANNAAIGAAHAGSAAGANPAHLIAAAPAAAPAGPSAGSSSLTMLFGLLLVLGLIVCIAWLLKRSGLTPAMHASAAAKVVGGVNVGNRERVVVVEIADQWIVVGVAPGRVNALATMPKQESPATLTPPGSASPAKNFSTWMKQTIEKRNASR